MRNTKERIFKKLGLMGLTIAIVIAASGCTNTAETSNSTPTVQSQEVTVSTSSESTAAVSSTAEASESSVEPQVSESSNEDALDKLVEYFKSNGFTVGAKSGKLAAMIGAKSGFGIELNGKNVEFYEYDLDSEEELVVESLKTAKEGYIDMSIMKINVVLNGNLLVTGYDLHPDKDKIIELFKNYK